MHTSGQDKALEYEAARETGGPVGAHRPREY